MAAKRSAGTGLTEKQTELMTDLMVMKLANMRPLLDLDTLALDPSRVLRDEVFMVVVDTSILMESEDIDATLERWASE